MPLKKFWLSVFQTFSSVFINLLLNKSVSKCLFLSIVIIATQLPVRWGSQGRQAGHFLEHLQRLRGRSDITRHERLWFRVSHEKVKKRVFPPYFCHMVVNMCEGEIILNQQRFSFVLIMSLFYMVRDNCSILLISTNIDIFHSFFSSSRYNFKGCRFAPDPMQPTVCNSDLFRFWPIAENGTLYISKPPSAPTISCGVSLFKHWH